MDLKRFPEDYSRDELIQLVHHHHKEHVKISTEKSDLLGKLIAVSKELSALKRKK